MEDHPIEYNKLSTTQKSNDDNSFRAEVIMFRLESINVSGMFTLNTFKSQQIMLQDFIIQHFSNNIDHSTDMTTQTS